MYVCMYVSHEALKHSEGSFVKTATTSMYRGNEKYYNYTANEAD